MVGVTDTGLYGIVRHPMYMATTVLFLAMPLVLASPISFIIMLGYIPLIAKRIKSEEKVLEEGLEGDAEYRKKVTESDRENIATICFFVEIQYLCRFFIKHLV